MAIRWAECGGSRFAVALIFTGLAGCAQPLAVTIPEPLRPPLAEAESKAALQEATESARPTTRFATTPKPPSVSGATTAGSVLSPLTEGDQRPVTLNIEGLAVPAFINEVYGNLLGLSFQMDGNVQKKTEMVNLRLTTPQPAAKVRVLADQALQDYEVVVEKRGAVLRFTTGKAAPVPDSPVFVFARKLPANLAENVPVVQFLTLEAVRNTQAAGWLRQAFQSQKVTISEDPERNALILTGQTGVVRQAGDAALLLDQPFMRGQNSLRIEPAYWTATVLAKRLDEILQAEGYSSSLRPGSGGSVLVLPMDEVNTVLVFTADERLLGHIRQWVERLDRPQLAPGQIGLFYYTVKNTPAQDLLDTLAPVLAALLGEAAASGGSGAAPPAAPAAAAAAAPVAGGAARPGGNQPATPAGASKTTLRNLAVDTGRNALLFSGTAEQWEKLRPVLETMDQPALLALIAVTVAEITLDDKQDTGIEWLFRNVNIGDFTGVLSNPNPASLLPASPAGLNYVLTNEGSRIMINALATNNQVTILSNPRLMVRNGQEASIEVGNDVPIVTSQASAPDVQQDGTSSILQQIQYRKSGVLLSVKPTIYAGRRVDLDITQEVSEPQRTTSSTINSPTFLTRTIKTSLSLKDGGTVMLGGLVSNSRSGASSGVPFLKDVPGLGLLFSKDSVTTTRTDLVVLITPYILRDEKEAEAITQTFRDRLNIEQGPPVTAEPVAAPVEMAP